MMNTRMQDLLAITEAQHQHLCPRQVLGVRMGMYAADLLALELPRSDKRLLTFVETDGCFADGIAAATGCTLGHRTLRLIDHGKTAAVFVDTETERAVRIHPAPEARARAAVCEPDARSRWHAQLIAYQTMPASEMFVAQVVELTLSIKTLISRPGVRVSCEQCGEEIINEREVHIGGRVLCKGCAGETYFSVKGEVAWSTINSAEPLITCASH